MFLAYSTPHHTGPTYYRFFVPSYFPFVVIFECGTLFPSNIILLCLAPNQENIRGRWPMVTDHDTLWILLKLKFYWWNIFALLWHFFRSSSFCIPKFDPAYCLLLLCHYFCIISWSSHLPVPFLMMHLIPARVIDAFTSLFGAISSHPLRASLVTASVLH